MATKRSTQHDSRRAQIVMKALINALKYTPLWAVRGAKAVTATVHGSAPSGGGFSYVVVSRSFSHRMQHPAGNEVRGLALNTGLN